MCGRFREDDAVEACYADLPAHYRQAADERPPEKSGAADDRQIHATTFSKPARPSESGISGFNP